MKFLSEMLLIAQSRRKHGSALKRARTKVRKRFVCAHQRIARGMRDDSDLWCQIEKIESVLLREIRYQHELPLLP